MPSLNGKHYGDKISLQSVFYFTPAESKLNTLQRFNGAYCGIQAASGGLFPGAGWKIRIHAAGEKLGTDPALSHPGNINVPAAISLFQLKASCPDPGWSIAVSVKYNPAAFTAQIQTSSL
jgi:hypothetical protein